MEHGLPGHARPSGRLNAPAPACRTAPMRFFNTEGPVRPDKHYCVPPLARLRDAWVFAGFVRAPAYAGAAQPIARHAARSSSAKSRIRMT